MSKYEINFRNLIGGLMPQALRGSLLSLAWMLTHGIRVLHLRGLAARTQHWKDMEYNCQYPLLQKLLNDELDPTDRRIRVREATGSLTTAVVFPKGTDHVQLVVDEPGSTVVVHPWWVYRYRPFEIVLPAGVYVLELIRVRKLADTYKLAGTKYVITEQENE
ncbi:MAG: hypothetical protein IJU33_05100 [Bacteroidales bacterium]|nr:hypothetical protein [Bacteroidales bacterium]